MSVNTQRQNARRRAREVRSEQERASRARDKRLEDLAVTVLTSIGTAAEHERRAGEALRTMVEDEGLSLREAVSWCGDEVSVRTAARFKRLVPGESSDTAEKLAERDGHGDGDGDGDGGYEVDAAVQPPGLSEGHRRREGGSH